MMALLLQVPGLSVTVFSSKTSGDFGPGEFLGYIPGITLSVNKKIDLKIKLVPRIPFRCNLVHLPVTSLTDRYYVF